MSDDGRPSLEEFEKLCRDACGLMNERARRDPEHYLSRGGQKLEKEVFAELERAAEGTAFEGTIEIVSGQRFPDIVVAEHYGVEVKSTKDDRWTLIGGSVAEGTRIEGVEHIFFLFGKLHEPVAFRTRRYEECLCDIAVTHSPRYKIDMDLPERETIFDKMGIAYDEMRKMPDPIRPVVEYFRSTLRPGESLWWVNGEDATSGAAPAKIRMWKTLSKEEREGLIAQGFALFPELFGDGRNKYERFTLWLVAEHGIVSSSMRDPFSAGGQSDLDVDGIHYKKLPQKYIQLSACRDKVEEVICKTDDEVLNIMWGDGDGRSADRMKRWIGLVSWHAQKEKFDVPGFLEKLFMKR